ncbi:MAG: 4'-phosphopantetheinyl transferase superfamily protein [Bacteroidota bacterium]
MASFQLTCEDRGLLTFSPFTNAFTLSTNECHIWLLNTNDNRLPLSHLIALLSPEEVAKANRFVFAEHRERYIIAHGLLRIILGKYAGLAPKAIQLGRTSNAKPVLVAGQGDYCFNLSHSADEVIVAVSQKEVGIDIEQIKMDFDWADIAQNYFCQEEISRLGQASAASVAGLFYQYWTRKEAFLKAISLGLIDDLQKINLSATHNRIWLNDDRLDAAIPTKWQILSGFIQNDYAISLAVPSDITPTRFHQAAALLS